MGKSEKPVLQVLSGQVPDRLPVWLMRQAGRYLPEYRALRAQAGSFLDLCLNADHATEITLQPIRRFGFDAAILFADILLIPMALGRQLEFREGEGPVLATVADDRDIESLIYDDRCLAPVFETVARVRQQLSPQTALIGFCGAPFTVACYMIDGNSRGNFAQAKYWAAERPELLQKLIDTLIDASENYLSRQIEAGAEVIQLFDSWAGLLNEVEFRRWVIAPTKALVSRLKKRHPAIPIIGFPREAGAFYQPYAMETGIDALGIDQAYPISQAKTLLQPLKALQGNLDPAILVKGGGELQDAVMRIARTFGPKHIFNLGHGVVPQTPPEHVAELVQIIRSLDNTK